MIALVSGAGAATACDGYLFTRQEHKSEKIVVVRAGISRLAAAVVLRAQGFDVDVDEKARQLHHVGATLTLAPNCLAVLNAISPQACERWGT